MLISLNKIKEYVEINIPTEELITLIGSRLVEVEGHTDLAPKYQGIKIAKVVSYEPIPDTHLHLCQISADDSGSTIQVVCGAPNVHAGMLAAWIMPGSIVPSTYGNENFKLSVRKLRGYESHGMLAAADELDLGSDHEGIIEIDPKMTITGPLGATRPVQPGDDFATAFYLNDIILDIENKSLTHRPDCFGFIGFAREVAGILGQKFKEPTEIFGAEMESLASGALASQLASRAAEARKDGPEAEQAAKGEADVEVQIMDPTLCPRYSCAVLDCTKLLEKSKYFTRQDALLAKSGMRPISPIVDLTNILMLEAGQPLHAFDYDKFVKVGGSKTPKIIVRQARAGEKLQLLDGKTIECVPTDILITSNDVPVALAGAMGGASTEIDASSQKIILESATFSLFNLRKTQMAHGIFSEAITRFTKGQPASQTLPVLHEAIRRLDTTPLTIADAYPAPAEPIVVKITTSEINALLGTNYDAATIQTTLENVGFVAQEVTLAKSIASGALASPLVSRDSEPRKDVREAQAKPLREEEQATEATLSLVAPSWRTDIHIKEDIIEEVGRLLGFDNIPVALPTKSFSGTAKEPMWQLKTELRNILSDQLGAHELLTYSFISGDLLAKVGEAPQDSYKIINSISPELQYFRQSLTPSLLDKIYQNIKAGHENFTIYELNQIVKKSEALDADQVPPTHFHLSVVTFGDFYQIKQIASAIAQRLRIAMPLEPATKHLPAYFEPLHSATTPYGHFGEIKKSVLRRFKLADYNISALEFDLEPVEKAPRSAISLPLLAFSKFPIVARDLTFRTPSDISYKQLESTLAGALQEEQSIIYELKPVSIYQSEAEKTHRNISFRLEFADKNQTLTSDQISAIIEKVITKIQTLGAAVV